MGIFGKKPPEPVKPSREQLIKEAMSNARTARENIGEETLQRIAEAIRKKEMSPLEQAKEKIRAMDKEKVAHGVRDMLHDDD